MKLNKFLKIILICLLLTCLGFYAAVVFLTPALITSDRFQKYIVDKVGTDIKFGNLEAKISPKLIIRLSSDEISLQKALIADNLTLIADIKTLSVKSVDAEYLFVDGDKIKKVFKSTKKSSKPFDIKKFPKINVKKADYASDSINAKLFNVYFDGQYAKFTGEVQTDILKNTISGVIKVKGKSVYAEDIQIKAGNSVLTVKGRLTDKNRAPDFTVKGRDLPVNEIEAALLHYQKSIDPAKKFIENFRNYSGKIDIDLKVNKTGIYGLCTAKKLSAKAVWFNIPLYFEKVDFKFLGKTITSNAVGTLGKEKARHQLNIIKLGSPDKEVQGNLTTTLHKNFKYIPNLTIMQSADANISYNIKNKKIDVKYLLNLDEGSDLIYKNAYLGLRDRKRSFSFETLKDGNKLYVTKYDYTLNKDGIRDVILTGDGLLLKQNGHFVSQYYTAKTDGYVPVSVTGSFGEYVRGGEFSGNLKYDFVKNQIFGNFILVNTRFKNFVVSRAEVSSDKTDFYVKADGTYANENFFCDVDAKNEFGKGIYVYRLNMFLNKLVIKKSSSGFDLDKIDIASKIKNNDITIKDWELRIAKIVKDRIVIKNITLLGCLQNDIFNFMIPDISFADGKMKAKGFYNFANSSSKIDFTANGINSDKAADMFFNLKGQVNGIADATLHLKTFNKLENIKGNVCFEIKEGFLPQLGNKGFVIKNSKTIKLANLTNADLTDKKGLKSDIKGSFNIDNSMLKNIQLTSKQKYLALYAEGKYDIDREFAEVNLFGKYYTEAPKGVKILFIPLNWIIKLAIRPEYTMELYKNKLQKIPEIEGEKSNRAFFRVKLLGNINNGNIKVEFKRVK